MTTTPSLGVLLESLGPLDPANMTAREARLRWTEYRQTQGDYRTYGPLLTPPETQRKLGKDRRVPLFSLTLAPASTSGTWNVCAWSTPKCRAACVLTARYPSVHKSRVIKTRFLADQPQAFVTLLADEMCHAQLRYGTIGMRLNAASDLRWERIAPELFKLPGVLFYDYTKAPAAQRQAEGPYRLVYSVSERPESELEAMRYLEDGGTAAVVFDAGKRTPLPATWHGFTVLDGDNSDNRYTEPGGTVVGLRAKGRALGRGRELAAGFVKPAVDS